MSSSKSSVQPQPDFATRTQRSALLLIILLGVIGLCAAYAPPKTSATTSPLIPSPLSSLPAPESPIQEVAAMVPPTPIPPQPTSTPTQIPFATQPPPSPLRPPKVLLPPVMINRAEGLLKEQVFTFFVERADGRQQIYFVPVAEVPLIQGEAGRPAYASYRQTLLQLESGDRVVYECASPTMRTVPEEFRCFGRKQVTLNTPP
jgi:hypothetical protein